MTAPLQSHVASDGVRDPSASKPPPLSTRTPVVSYTCSMISALGRFDVSCRWHRRCPSVVVEVSMCETRAGILSGLEVLVAGLDPNAMTGEHAKELVRGFSRVEHLACAGKTLCAGRVAATGVFAEGGERSAATWLAGETGDSVGGALRLIEAAGQLKKLPVLEGAFRAGELSAGQLSTAAGAAAVDPSKEKELLEQAQGGSMRHLRREADRVRAAARSEHDAQARYEAVRARRSLRWWTDLD